MVTFAAFYDGFNFYFNLICLRAFILSGPSILLRAREHVAPKWYDLFRHFPSLWFVRPEVLDRPQSGPSRPVSTTRSEWRS